MEPIHGGDVTGYRLRFGRMPLDFSASLNPFGMPPAVRDAARRAVDDATPYPDPLCRELKRAVAGQYGIPESYLFFGNGAADVIYRFAAALRPRKALIPVPTFVEYERALTAAGCEIKFHHLRRENNFQMAEDFLADMTGDVDAVFLCQPNNPTGLMLGVRLSDILGRAARTGATVFLDECFCRFMDGWERHTAVHELSKRDNLFILDSFTKLYAMAGIRLGFGMTGNAALLEKVIAAGPPWSVSAIAQAAGLAALGETEYVERSLEAIRSAREDLVAGLRRLGATVIGFGANYVFFHDATPELGDRLMREGILIRNCANFRGLEPGYHRVAVRLKEENGQLLRAIEKVKAADK